MADIIVVEDNEEIGGLLQDFLIAEGYDTYLATTGEEGLEVFEEEDAKLFILDIMLPGMDGMEILSCLKKNDRTKEIPVIMATAKGAEYDKVQGLDAGADDYVTKPFGMLELVSRVKAVLRRTQKNTEVSKSVIEIKGISIDLKKHEVLAGGQTVVLTLKEYELLKRLLQNPNIVLTRDQLLEEIWGYDFAGETRTVDVHVRTLRQKLGEYGDRIETVRGVGYRVSC